MQRVWPFRVLAACLLALAVPLMAGCGSYGRPVALSLSPRLAAAAPSVEVDLIGVQSGELETWSHYSMTQYWADQNPATSFRLKAIAAGSVKVVRLGNTQGGTVATVTLPADDPIWEKWRQRGAESLLVLSSIPPTADDAPGERDPRRRVFPIASSGDNAAITLQLDRGGLVTIKG